MVALGVFWVSLIGDYHGRTLPSRWGKKGLVISLVGRNLTSKNNKNLENTMNL